MMHFGIVMLGGAAGLGLSCTKDDKAKKSLLAAAAVLHAGCSTVSAYGQNKKLETKKGAIMHYAINAACVGLSIAGLRVK